MKIINKYFLAFAAAFSLITLSCSDIDSGDEPRQEEKSVVSEIAPVDTNGKVAQISVNLLGATAETSATSRTILPNFTDSTYTTSYKGFDKFVLKGKPSGGTERNLASWSAIAASGDAEAKTAYQNLTSVNNVISFNLSNDSAETEDWSFTLTGYHNGDETSSLTATNATVTVFEGTCDITVVAGPSNSESNPKVNMLDFTLLRKSKYNFDTSKTNGTIKITLDFKTSATVKTVTLNNKTSGTAVPVTTAPSVNNSVYTWSRMSEGKYSVQFDFENNGVAVGSISELIYVFNDMTSEATLTVDPNGTFPISYKYVILDDTVVSHDVEDNTIVTAASSLTSYYSRLVSVALPKATDFTANYNNSDNSTYLFCGWYEDEALTTGPILEIPENTAIGAKTYYAKFIKRAEMADLTSIALAGNVTVGHTLTATPKTGNADFTGTIAAWQWYVGEDVATYISEATSASYTIPPKVGATLLAGNEDPNSDKKLSVRAVKKYYVRAYNETDKLYSDTTKDHAVSYTLDQLNTAGVYKVVEFKNDNYAADNATNTGFVQTETNETTNVEAKLTENEKGTVSKTVATETLVQKGSLAVTSSFDLQYTYPDGEANAEGVESLVIGTSLSSAKLETSFVGNYANIVDANVATWTLDALNTALSLNPSIAFDENAIAPDSSNYVKVTIKLAGYNDLVLNPSSDRVTGEIEGGAFVKVRYPDPVNASDVLSALWSGMTESAVDVRKGFDKGYISLRNATYDVTNGTDSTVVVSNVPLAYKIGTGNLVKVVASDAGTGQVAVRTILGGTENVAADINVLAGENATSSITFYAADTPSTATTGNPVGAIYGSKNGLEIDFGETTGSGDNITYTKADYIGTRVRITGLAIQSYSTESSSLSEVTPVSEEENATNVAVGKTLVVKPVYNGGDDSITENYYSDISWTWTRSDASSTVSGTANTAGANSSHRVLQDDWVGDNAKLTVTAVHNNPFDGDTTNTATIALEKGTMKLNEFAVRYADTRYTLGSAIIDSDHLSYPKSTGTEEDTVRENNDSVLYVLDANTSTNVEVSGYAVSFVDSASVVKDAVSGQSGLATTGKALIKITANGYNDYTGTAASPYYVTGIKLKGTLTENSVALSTDKQDISQAYLKFNSTSGVFGKGTDDSETELNYNFYELEYAASDDASVWYDVPEGEFEKANSGLSGLTAGEDTKFYVRTKAKYVTSNAVYYGTASANTITWKNESLETQSSLSATETYTSSEPIGVSYTSENEGKRGVGGFKIDFLPNADKSLSWSKNGSEITITAENQTVAAWLVDGKTVADFIGYEELQSGNDADVKSSGDTNNVLTINITRLKSGTYPVTAIILDSTTGITYEASLSFAVSK